MASKATLRTRRRRMMRHRKARGNLYHLPRKTGLTDWQKHANKSCAKFWKELRK